MVFCVYSSHEIKAYILLSLQILISAVSDLFTKLLEDSKASACILKDYIECLGPSKSEWEKMRESLSNEVQSDHIMLAK